MSTNGGVEGQSEKEVYDQNYRKFLTEVMILDKFNNGNIIRFHEIFEDDLRLYIVTDLCLGGDLFSFIQKHKDQDFMMDETHAAQIIDKVLCALIYLHQHQIILMDLKPENILFSSPDNYDVQLIDFHNAQATCGDQKLKHLGKALPSADANAIAGTPYYMAPEIILQGEEATDPQTGETVRDLQVTEKVDIWSVGVILYIMLTGLPPFVG